MSLGTPWPEEASLLHLGEFSFDFRGFFFYFAFIQDQGCPEIEWRFVLHINKSANRSRGILIRLRQIG